MLTDRGTTKADLSRAAGVSKTAVKMWIDGTTQNIDHEKARNIEAAWGYSADWITYGKGPIKSASAVTPEMQQVIADLIDLDRIGGERRDDVIYFIRKLLPRASNEKTG